MSHNNDSSQWGGPNGANADEFRNSAGQGDAGAKNPFGGRSGGPPVFYRSKQAATDDSATAPQRDTEAVSRPESRPAPVQSKFLSLFPAAAHLVKLCGRPEALQN